MCPPLPEESSMVVDVGCNRAGGGEWELPLDVLYAGAYTVSVN